jgi:hypothetical protein
MSRNLEEAIDKGRALFAAGESEIDPGMANLGLRHEVLQIGSGSFVEICTPLDPTDASPGSKFLRGGEGGYMLVIEVSSAEELRNRVTAAGLKLPFVDLHEGNDVTQLHPREFGTLVEADQIRTAHDWHYPTLESCPTVTSTTGMIAVDVAVEDPAAMISRWIEIFDVTPVDQSSVALSNGGIVRFIPADGQRRGVIAIDVAASRNDDIGRSETLCGITVRFR